MSGPPKAPPRVARKATQATHATRATQATHATTATKATAPATPRWAPRVAPAPAAPPAISFQQLPVGWIPQDEPWLDRVTRTDLRLATTLALAGLVAVFVTQVPLGGQIVVGAPLFEEFFKVGVALLPWAALGVRSLWARLPTALAVGGGFGAFEHWFSYPGEPAVVAYGRIFFHALTAGLSMAVLSGLHGSDRRLGLAITLPSTFLHAANNSTAVTLTLASIALGLDVEQAETLGLGVATGFLVALALLCLTWPLWMVPYRRLLERWFLPRLRPA